MGAKSTQNVAANDVTELELSPLSQELVIGLTGYAGAGCSTTTRRLHIFLSESGYIVYSIKLSKLIADQLNTGLLPPIAEGSPSEGAEKLHRATSLQNMGDQLRRKHGANAVSALGIREIRRLRGDVKAGETKLAFILDSIKHKSEVDLLRRVYDQSFRLLAVHCDRQKRESRLIGTQKSAAKYRGVEKSHVYEYMDRDEKDAKNDFGQGVRDAFYLADYFIDNSADSASGELLNHDLQRFVNLLVGESLVRPTQAEKAMYYAHAAARQSACLSRQVGAALAAPTGEILATGTNDVPKFGGGVYDEDSVDDHRCHAWEWADGELRFTGCHNDRRKKTLRAEIGTWLSDNLAAELAQLAYPQRPGELDASAGLREEAETRMRDYLSQPPESFENIPGIKDLIEYSRAIHAEMDTILGAARSGISPKGATLYCTTYPCHNCARHLVTAGVKKVFFIEPYVKSLAAELHSDSITTEPASLRQEQAQMAILPFTGVGPRMYDDFFSKRTKLKKGGGTYVPPKASAPIFAVRLRELADVERAAASLIPEGG